MTISELRQFVFKIESKYGPDVPVFLMDEETTLSEGFDQKYYHAISDIRVLEDWPLPGDSIMHDESEKTKKIHIVMFERWVEDPAYIDSSVSANND